MKRYSFAFRGIDFEKLEKLIDYIEKQCKIKYLATREFGSLFSFNIPFLGLNVGGFKQIVFDGFCRIKSICPECGFVSRVKDAVFVEGTTNILQCQCCLRPLYDLDKKAKKWVKRPSPK